jgi:flagellin
VDFSTANKASVSIGKIDKLLEMTATKQAELGATMNRLECIMTNQTTMVENVSSALSSIQDADIAEETSSYVKAQIQVQTASALFSQVRNLHYELTMMLLESALSL